MVPGIHEFKDSPRFYQEKKSPIFRQKSPMVSLILSVVCGSDEPCIQYETISKEPCVFSKEPYIRWSSLVGVSDCPVLSFVDSKGPILNIGPCQKSPMFRHIYIYIYIYMHIHIYTYIYIYTHIYIYAYMHYRWQQTYPHLVSAPAEHQHFECVRRKGYWVLDIVRANSQCPAG